MARLNRVLPAVAILLVAAGLSAVLRSRGDVRSDRQRFQGARLLADSLEPLAAEFDRLQDRPRLLAVLSPACPVCLAGLEAVEQEVLVGNAEIAVLIVWMEALPFDITRNPGRRVAVLAGDPRVTQFYDSGQLAGRWLGAVLGWPGESLAWDVYVFFEAGTPWGDPLPKPYAWFHQRDEGDPAHFRTGPGLAEALRLAAAGLLD
jgi:hypothetical protein